MAIAAALTDADARSAPAILRHDRWLAPPLGALATLGFAPFGLWPLALLALAALFWLAQHASWRRAALLGGLFGFAHFGTGLYWIYISTHVFGGAPAWLAVLLCIALFSYLALYPALVLGVASALSLWRSPLGWIGLPSLWLLGELLRGWVYSGFPWLSLGYLALDTPLVRFAPLLGVHGLSALLLLSAYALFRAGISARRPLALAAAPLPFVAALFLPPPERWTAALDEHLKIAIVQGNVPQDQKWNRGMTRQILQRYRQMSFAALDADLVVWPEAVPNYPYERVRPYFDELAAAARAQDAALLAGVLMQDGDSTIYNSMLALGAAAGRYDKQHLVPFGEYFPIPDWLRPLMDVLGTPYSDFSTGGRNQAPIDLRGRALGISICFEDVFGDELRRQAQVATLLINATNDAWFGRSSAPHQHLQIARMRAIETGRWLVRAANTGISAFIGPRGEIARQTALFETALLRAEVPMRAGATPYVRHGDAPLWVFSGAVLLLLVGLQIAPPGKGARAGR